MRGRPGRELLASAKEQAGPAKCAPGRREAVSGQNPPVLAFETPASLSPTKLGQCEGSRQLSASQASANGSRRWGLSQ